MNIAIRICVLIILSYLTSCQIIPDYYPEAGVNKGLANNRSERISDLHYHLIMDVPAEKSKAIKASAKLSFALKSHNKDLFLDFKANNHQLISVIVNSDTLIPKIVNEHIKIPSSVLQKTNKVKINFVMGDGPLNRNDNYFYSLFVPDRARTCLPCFDQPDIKARFSVSMTIPENWIGIANGPKVITQVLENKTTIDFAASKPISTYLWAFCAGEFEKCTTNWKGKEIGLYHMIEDSIKLQQNQDNIFKQTTESLNWLEEYCNYNYPFESYNLVAIPSFQFGGMEHPGATYYRSELIFLEEEPTENEKLKRANLIAHETAHMWFGDLVTMPWFDEVWLKEVFANFMADKITQPWFPEINHQLRFLLEHFPKAYSVDRTLGANPINQKLNNLNNAGTLYGAIIYHKSPIIMAQLESMAGSETLQLGVQEYLNKYAYDNASWDDLIECIDKYTENDLKVWSKAWINKAGRPVIKSIPDPNNPDEWQLKQSGEHTTSTGPNFWPQEINIKHGSDIYTYDFYDTSVKTNSIPSKPESIIFCDDKGYGLFIMNEAQLNYWMTHSTDITDPLLRGRVCLNLYENLLDGSIHPKKYLNFLISALQNESQALLINAYCSQLKTVFWKLLPQKEWQNMSSKTEGQLWTLLNSTDEAAIQKTLYRCWLNIAMSDSSLNTMARLCQADQKILNLTLSDKDRIELVAQLAIKKYPNWRELYQIVYPQISNEPNKNLLDFCLPALSNKHEERDAFWASLSDVKMRHKEKWVEQSLSYLHHPLRSNHSASYLNSTLALLEEIQQTGDIFFPINWLNNSLNLYSSSMASETVNNFLNKHPNFPDHLKLKILQNSDMLNRSISIKNRYW